VLSLSSRAHAGDGSGAVAKSLYLPFHRSDRGVNWNALGNSEDAG
jgi:hypothetical protein